MEEEFEAWMETYWREVLGLKPVPVPLSLPQIPHEAAWDRTRPSCLLLCRIWSQALHRIQCLHVYNTKRGSENISKFYLEKGSM